MKMGFSLRKMGGNSKAFMGFPLMFASCWLLFHLIGSWLRFRYWGRYILWRKWQIGKKSSTPVFIMICGNGAFIVAAQHPAKYRSITSAFTTEDLKKNVHSPRRSRLPCWKSVRPQPLIKRVSPVKAKVAFLVFNTKVMQPSVCPGVARASSAHKKSVYRWEKTTTYRWYIYQ